MRVAVCQEWATTWSGSEQVAARLAQLLDADDVYTFGGTSAVLERAFPGRRVHTSRLGRTRFAQRRWQWLLPVMARWWRRLDLASYDMVVTCSHAASNSIRVAPSAVHVSYCCTPMRYAWLWKLESKRLPRALRPILPIGAAILRWGDRRRSRNVDVFIAVSQEVSERIERFYGRPSTVVYPPIDTEFFTPDESVPRGDFYLFAGRLVAYKAPEAAVHAANAAGVPLVVAGSGPELDRLRHLAGPQTRFVESPSDGELRTLYRQARALVYPGIEDFGMTLVEAQACGTPVIALARGGAKEAVSHLVSGVLYEEDSPAALANVLREFGGRSFDPLLVAKAAQQFNVDRFDAGIRAVMNKIENGAGEHELA